MRSHNQIIFRNTISCTIDKNMVDIRFLVALHCFVQTCSGASGPMEDMTDGLERGTMSPLGGTPYQRGEANETLE